MKPVGRDPDWRHKKRFIPFSAMPDGGENFAADDLTPEEEAWEKKRSEAVENALMELHPLDRQIIELNQGLDGDDPMKKTEIARRLGYSRTTIHKRLKVAKNQLCLKLKPYSFK